MVLVSPTISTSVPSVSAAVSTVSAVRGVARVRHLGVVSAVAVLVRVVLDVLGAAVRQRHAVVALSRLAVIALAVRELGAVVRVVDAVGELVGGRHAVAAAIAASVSASVSAAVSASMSASIATAVSAAAGADGGHQERYDNQHLHTAAAAVTVAVCRCVDWWPDHWASPLYTVEGRAGSRGQSRVTGLTQTTLPLTTRVQPGHAGPAVSLMDL